MQSTNKLVHGNIILSNFIRQIHKQKEQSTFKTRDPWESLLSQDNARRTLLETTPNICHFPVNDLQVQATNEEPSMTT